MAMTLEGYLCVCFSLFISFPFLSFLLPSKLNGTGRAFAADRQREEKDWTTEDRVTSSSFPWTAGRFIMGMGSHRREAFYDQGPFLLGLV